MRGSGVFSIGGCALGALIGMIVEDLGLPFAFSFWGDTGPLVVVFAIAGAILHRTFLERWLEATAAALMLLWLTVAFTPLTAWLEAGLTRRDAPAPSDAVFVAASSIQLDGELTPVAMSRLLHGIELLAETATAPLVLSDLGHPNASYAAAARKLLDRFAKDRELIVSAAGANTHDEAMALARLCREREWKRVTVVTSPYHSRRACGAAEHEGVGVICSPSMETQFDAESLENSRERRVAFPRIVHETIGLWMYRRRGWL